MAKKAGILTLDLGALLHGGVPQPKVSTADLAVFTRQFATMISSGIAALECLDILREQADDPGFHLVMDQVVEDVKGGLELSTAFGKHRMFQRIYINMLRAGEASGQLDEILVRLADYMESAEKLKNEIKSAMTYPIVSILMVTTIAIFLMVFIIPQFEQIFLGLGVELPAPTKAVLFVSWLMRTYAIHGILAFAAVIVAIVMWKKTESGGYYWDAMLLKLPVFGPLFKKVAMSRFTRTFATLIRSGVSILNALEIVGATSGNRVVEVAMLAARDSIRSGEQIAEPLSRSPIFPLMVVRMIAVGEQSGRLEDLLEKISDFYDQQVSATVEQLTSLIEPIMIAVMGLLVGGIVLAVFLPILKLQGQLAGR